MAQQKVVKEIFLPSVHDGIRLEARLSYWKTKENVQEQQAKAVIISHPYGPLGGNNYNNVVIALENFFLHSGYLTIAFNFRGSGKSRGRTSWTGESESNDFRTMLNFIANSGKINDDNIVIIPKIYQVTIIGYSYGSLIATSLASTPTEYSFPISYILISLPLSVTWFLTFFHSSVYSTHLKNLLSSSSTKVLFVFGDSDQFTRVSKYRQWIKDNNVLENERWTVAELNGADHFFAYQQMEVALIDVIEQWVRTNGSENS
ncbi:Alpha/Beta hydrolase protein [Glomus cerebriforme]|uniref:Alpha/Beta hydrolase protein n=1 Tax=Glomus cerebriforme TaxID=658196 RepID=A0A397SS36_9GLOM|nr:Alpha/Beta hydrolase protein [Glomus cerebriforme]